MHLLFCYILFLNRHRIDVADFRKGRNQNYLIQYSNCYQKHKRLAMTKIFEFSHHGEKIRSVAIFNFEQSKCSVMVMPYAHKEELGNTIVITRNNRDWISEAPIVEACRLTYLNILNELDLMIFQNEHLNNASAKLRNN